MQFRRHRRGRAPHPDILTPAEWRVLTYVRAGHQNAEIAARLGVSVHTVKSHVSSMLGKLELRDRAALAAWDGEPVEASRVALQRRVGLATPVLAVWHLIAGGWARGGAVVLASVAIGIGLYLALQNATVEEEAFLTVPILATSTPMPEPSEEPTVPQDSQAGMATKPELFVAQVRGQRGCDQPLFIRAGGLPASTRVRVERADNPGARFVTATSTTGFINVRDDRVLTQGCAPGNRYAIRVVEDTTGFEFASREFEAPAVTTATIEIKPPNGGCGEIAITFRGFPPRTAIRLNAWEPEPFAHNGFQVISPEPIADSAGYAQTPPFKPPWSCDTLALSLAAAAGEGDEAVRAELLYRIALGPSEPIPALECTAATNCIQVP